MPDLDAIIAANRSAVDDFIAAAESCESAWSVPRAPGKWSPAQLTEHVAMALEEGGNVVSERPTKLPSLPALVRPLARVFLKRVVKTHKFPKAKTNSEMNPAAGPATLDEARDRLHAAMDIFERACRSRASAGGRFTSMAFGKLTVEDYAAFVEQHTRHHTKQMTLA